jgi:hypothetical protein
VLAAAAALLAAPEGRANWTQYRGDSGRTANAAWPAAGAPVGAVAWRVEIGDGAMVDASPVVNPTTSDVYVGTTADSALGGRARLFAFRTLDGRLRWAVPLGRYDVRAPPAVRPGGFPVVVGHRAVVERDPDRGEVWASRERAFLVNPFTGAVVRSTGEWGSGAGIRTFRAAPVVDTTRTEVYIHTGRGLSLYGRSFELIRDIQVVVGVRADSAGAWRAIGTGIVGFFRNLFPRWDPSGRASLSPEPPLLPRLPSPAFSTVCDDVVWGMPRAARASRHLLRANGFQPPFLLTTPALGGAGRMYAVAHRDGRSFLHAFDQSGRAPWHGRALPGGRVSPPAIGRAAPGRDRRLAPATCTRTRGGVRQPIRDHRLETVYVTAGRTLFAFGDRGQVRWRDNPGGGLLGEPVVIQLRDGRHLVVVAEGSAPPTPSRGSLVAYRDDGTAVWRVFLDGPALGSPAVANGQIFVATTKSLYAIR